MKTIKSLTVKVTYHVQLSDIKVPENIYNELNENEEISSSDIKPLDAMDWLSSHIKEDEAMEWTYEIDDIEEA